MDGIGKVCKKGGSWGPSFCVQVDCAGGVWLS